MQPCYFLETVAGGRSSWICLRRQLDWSDGGEKEAEIHRGRMELAMDKGYQVHCAAIFHGTNLIFDLCNILCSPAEEK